MGKLFAGLSRTRYAFSCVVLLAMGLSMAVAATRPRLAAIDNASRVRLANSTHRATTLAHDLGRVDPNLRVERMLLVLGPADDVQPALRTFVESLHDRRSPNYHRWLTPEQFGKSFGPAQSDLNKLAAWLEQQGFDGIKVSRGGSHIEFSGTAQSVERAFQTEIHSYQNASGTHFANSSDISIPRALTGLVRGVNLQNFSLSRPMLTQPIAVKRDLSTGHWAPANPQSNFFSPSLIDPSDFTKIYDLDRVYGAGLTGTGETIAVVSRTTAVELSDVEAFRQAFHLPPNSPNVIMNGPPTAFGIFGPGSSDAQESTLDVEWSGAIAPNATIDLVISGTTAATDGVDLSSAYIVDNNLADIMTVSFGECEANLGPARNSFFNAIFAQAAAQGISVLVGSGDSGAAECDPAGANTATGGAAVSGIASTPFDTAVGGTEFDDQNIPVFWTQDGLIQVPNGYFPESVWNESATAGTLFGTGGGVSTIYPKPSWQNTAILGMPNDNARDLPDVSLTAAGHDAYIICLSPLGTCTSTTFGDQSVLNQASAVGGTSVSVQVFGAIMALVDQKLGGRQGLANYGLYRLAANENYANCNSSNQTDPTVPPAPECVFNDITTGNNGVPGNDTLGNNPPPGDTPGQLGYNATPGYDPVTGLGSVNAFNLVNAWSALGFSPSTTTLAATTATSVQHGQTVSFSISVAAGSGSAVPTGSVGLIAKTSNPFSTGIGVGGGTLVNGVFTGSFNTLPGGQYNVVAHYAGDGNFAPSDSNPIPVNVTSEASTVAIIGYAQSVLQSSPSPLTFGYGVPFVVGFQVTSASGAGIPTGTVTVLDNGQQVAQAPVSNTGYTLLTNCQSVGFCLGFGQHTLTASYSGDAGLGSSTTSQPFVYNIVKGQPQAFITMGSSVPGNVFFTLSFLQSSLPIFPTGTVTITDHINRDVKTIKTYNLTKNPIDDIFLLPFSNNIQFIFISYSGDANYLPVTAAVAQFLFPPSGLPTQVTITPLTSPIVIGQPVTLKATVTPLSPSSLTPTGFADWFSGSTLLNPNLASSFTEGTATIQAIMPNSGPIMVQYAGDSNFAPSAGVFDINQATAQVAPVIAVTSNLATTTPSEQVTLTAALTPPPETVNPTGFIQFFDSLNGAPPVALGARQPVLALQGPFFGAFDVPLTTNLPLGTHVITVSYAGDGNFKPVPAANSIPATVTVVDSLPANPVSPNFGAVNVGTASSTQSVNVLFTGSGTVSSVSVVTQGAIHSNFELVDAGTCVAQTPFTAGQSCMVNVTYTPNFAGTSMGAVVLSDAKGNVLGRQNIVGQGSASQIAFDSGAIFGLEFSGKITLTDPESLATDGLGNVFIADNGNQRVLKVLPSGCSRTNSCQTEVATSANGLGGANGVAVDGAGNLFVSDAFKNQVVMVPPGCSAVNCTQIVASQSGGEISTPRQLAVDGAGDLFIADQTNNRVVEVPAGCATSACQVALGSGLGAVFGVAVDGAGDVFISDSGNGQVVKLPAGCTTASCQSVVASGLTAPQNISVDAAGNLYIAESTQILEISAATGNQVNLIANVGLAPNANLTGVAFGPGGSVFIADAGASKVARLDRGDPPSVNFFNTTTPFGSRTAAQLVTVENIGTQPLSLQSVAVTQSAALDPVTTTCTSGSQVAVGASCTLGIEFAPTQLIGINSNFLQGNIVLVDNTLNQLNYNFNGNGVVARAAAQTIFVNGFAGNSQIITFPPLPSPVGVSSTPIPLQATANSGLPITYFVSGPASVEGSTLVVTAPGTVTVTATQPGDAQFVAATPVSQTITVSSQSPSFSISSSPSALTLAAGQSATAMITVTPSGGFNSPITMGCSQQSLVVCSFQPATLAPSSGPMTTTLKVTASSALADLRPPGVGNPGRFTLGFAVLGVCFGIVMLPVGRPRRKQRARVAGMAAGMLGLLLASVLVVSTTSCGSINRSGGAKPPQTQNAIVTVTASGGNVNQSLTLNVTVSQ